MRTKLVSIGGVRPASVVRLIFFDAQQPLFQTINRGWSYAYATITRSMALTSGTKLGPYEI
jgi:hypothetical protein